MSGCKATAADLLDKHHHEFIKLGGKWRLREFKKVKGAKSTAETNLWRVSEEEEEDLFLEADGVIKIPLTGKAAGKGKAASKGKATRKTRKTSKPTKYKQLTMVNFPATNLIHTALQLHHFYRPSDTNFPTFDSFYMDEEGHGITFQATEGKEHSVKPSGLEWLEERGITKMTYILVSGPKTGQLPSISLSCDLEAKFDRYYHLVLDYPELKALLLEP